MIAGGTHMKKHQIQQRDTLKRQMFFIDARNYQNTDNLTLSELQEKSNELKIANNLKEAIYYAKTAAIHFGIEGMMLYLPLQCDLIHAEYEAGEVIQQASQKTLALIFFVEEKLKNQADAHETLSTLESLKNGLLDIIENRDFITREAHHIADEMLSHTP